MMQFSKDNQKRPLTDGKNDIIRSLRKKPSFAKIESGSLMSSMSSGTLALKKEIEKPVIKKDNGNNESDKSGITPFSLSKNKNVKLAPLNTSLSTAQNSENNQPSSGSQITVKQSYLRKSILAAHKMAEEQMKKEENKTEEFKDKEQNIDEYKSKVDDYNQKEEKLNINEKEVSSICTKKHDSKKENFVSEIKGKIIKWKMGDYIGTGNFGQVFRAMELESGKIIAVKKIPFTNRVNKQNLKDLENELSILQKLKHKNIVEYLGHEQIENDLYIYLEYVSGGSIRSILSKFGSLPEQTIKVYAKQILLGLDFLHSKKVIHKDIKGANILVDAEGTVKLADFGCAGELEKTLSDLENVVSETLKGSVPWMAPEVVKETGYGRRSDIWSFGCTILEMATGQTPWGEFNYENHVALLMKIALSDEIPHIPDFLSLELRDFLKACLQRESSNRPYAKDLLKHNFLSDI